MRVRCVYVCVRGVFVRARARACVRVCLSVRVCARARVRVRVCARAGVRACADGCGCVCKHFLV